MHLFQAWVFFLPDFEICAWMSSPPLARRN
jgi:hypothetical protein